jgi:hypothetical protein
MAEPRIAAQQRKCAESIRSDETVTLPLSAPIFVVEDKTAYIRANIALTRAYADAIVGEGLDVEIGIGPARPGFRQSIA